MMRALHVMSGPSPMYIDSVGRREKATQNEVIGD